MSNSETSDELKTAPATATTTPLLNDAQRLHLRVSCEYMDKMLQEIEGILHSAESASPFSKYQIDLSPAQGRVMEDYIRRFRSQLLRALAWQHIEPPPPNIPATRAISTHLHFVDIAISELRPNQMRGSGELSETTAAELTGILRELSFIYENMMTYVKYELQESLQQRVEKLVAEGKGSSLLQRIESVVTAQGLVEFRPRLDMLLARLEDSSFEVAVFGRVSSGKSSFLDALLETDLLPVGINPITAVPTRVQYGERVAASVRFGNGALTEVSLDRFRELISEGGNPGNREGVRYALLKIPSERLSEGIVLVDTPGLGSLALKGAQETLAYLPSCDLAIILIDAGATLTPEDIGTLRLVLEAGISALVLLSKADLLREEDRTLSVEYVKAQIERELRTTIPVHAVSSLQTFKSMIDNFYKQELKPRFRQSHELRLQSVHNKLVRLQHDVIASLEAKLQRTDLPSSFDSAVMPLLEKMLMNVAGQLGVMERTLTERILALGFEGPSLVEQAAEHAVASLIGSKASTIPLSDLSRVIQMIVEGEVAEMIALLRKSVQDTVGGVRRVGEELKSSGIPDEQELVASIRDAPRFELSEIWGDVTIGFTAHFGVRAVRKRLVKDMQAKLLPVLQRELTAYSSFLDIWAKKTVRYIQFSVNSFADIYRASIQEMTNTQNIGKDRSELAHAIAFLNDETEPGQVIPVGQTQP